MRLHRHLLACAAALIAWLAATAANNAQAGDAAVPRATRHALVIGIGDYGQPAVPRLPGVGHDVESARRMARAMAIPDAQVTVLRDAQATAPRIREALHALTRRVMPGDRVFVYYSGHGTRSFDPETRRDGCTEGLLAADAQVITNVELAGLMKPLADKVDKLFVFYDACFSGGVAGAAVRTLGAAQPETPTLTPKFTLALSPQACAQPSNFRTRGLALVLQQGGGAMENVVHVAASRPDELSFDSASRGGLATVAWRDCLLGEARDLDGSGAITVEEVTQCAQARLSAALVHQPGITGQHLTVAGNPAFVPAWEHLPPTAAGPATATPADVLGEVHRQRHGGRFVDIALGQPSLRIGHDGLDLRVTSLRAGHVYVALAGSDGQSLYLLFPNALDGDNRIKAGQTLRLPRPRWQIVAGGPPGRNTLLVMVTDSPRDLSGLAAERLGPFLKTLLDERGRARLQALLVDGTPAACTGGSACSDAYGAALVSIDEVR